MRDNNITLHDRSNEYVDDATRALGVRPVRVSERVRASLLWRVESLADLEKVIVRVVALLSAPSLSRAAERLGMAAVSLSRWASRRGLLEAVRDGGAAPRAHLGST